MRASSVVCPILNCYTESITSLRDAGGRREVLSGRLIDPSVRDVPRMSAYCNDEVNEEGTLLLSSSRRREGEEGDEEIKLGDGVESLLWDREEFHALHDVAMAEVEIVRFGRRCCSFGRDTLLRLLRRFRRKRTSASQYISEKNESMMTGRVQRLAKT